ncbi:MAG: DUF5615 family PIN-like protein [Cytophagales bacterium]|nr:DUF5615 family PIN-like protein [Cytophagales bacterium]
MKLLLDANISWRVVNQLKNHFESVYHILDFFDHHETDENIWKLAAKENYIIVTNDEDFVKLSSIKGWPPKILLLKTGNQSNTFILNLLLAKKPEIESFAFNDELGVLVIR